MSDRPLVEIVFRQDPSVYSTIKNIQGCKIDRGTMLKLTEMQMEFDSMVDQLNDCGVDVNLSVYYWDIVIHALGYKEPFCISDFIRGMKMDDPTPEQILSSAEYTLVTH